MGFDLFTPKAPPLFGLDVSSSSVKMLEIVDAGKGAYRVDRYAMEALPRDAVVDGNVNNLEAVAEAVKRAYKRLGTRTERTGIEEQVLHARILEQVGMIILGGERKHPDRA